MAKGNNSQKNDKKNKKQPKNAKKPQIQNLSQPVVIGKSKDK